MTNLLRTEQYPNPRAFIRDTVGALRPSLTPAILVPRSRVAPPLAVPVLLADFWPLLLHCTLSMNELCTPATKFFRRLSRSSVTSYPSQSLQKQMLHQSPPTRSNRSCETNFSISRCLPSEFSPSPPKSLSSPTLLRSPFIYTHRQFGTIWCQTCSLSLSFHNLIIK